MKDKPASDTARQSFAFLAAALAFLTVGIALGLHMSSTNDHILAPVHAHINLLGWVSCAIMGLYYGYAKPPIGRRLMQLQFWTYTGGVAAMMAGLSGILKEGAALQLFLGPGVGLTLTGLALFTFAMFRGYQAAMRD